MSAKPNSRSILALAGLLLVTSATRAAWMWMISLPPAQGSQPVSFDLRSWVAAAGVLAAGRNPYHETASLNYPPFWMEWLFMLIRIIDRFGMDILFWLRSSLIVADLALLIAVDWLMRMFEPCGHRRLLLIGYALNPLLAILTVQHGNFDAFALVWVVLFLGMLIRFHRSGDGTDWLCAAGFLGLAIFTKTFPLMLWPLLLSGTRKLDWKSRFLGLALVLGPVILSLLPLYVIETEGITQSVLAYRSHGADFGVLGLLALYAPDSIIQQYTAHSSTGLLLATVLLAAILAFRPIHSESKIVLLAGIILLSIFTFGPGYGGQYWFWVFPLFIAVAPNHGRAFGIVLAVAAAIIIATNLFEYALAPDLGQFWLCRFASSSLSTFGYKWLHDRNLIVVRLPMIYATFVALAFAVRQLFKRASS